MKWPSRSLAKDANLASASGLRIKCGLTPGFSAPAIPFGPDMPRQIASQSCYPWVALTRAFGSAVQNENKLRGGSGLWYLACRVKPLWRMAIYPQSLPGLFSPDSRHTATGIPPICKAQHCSFPRLAPPLKLIRFRTRSSVRTLAKWAICPSAWPVFFAANCFLNRSLPLTCLRGLWTPYRASQCLTIT